MRRRRDVVRQAAAGGRGLDGHLQGALRLEDIPGDVACDERVADATDMTATSWPRDPEHTWLTWDATLAG